MYTSTYYKKKAFVQKMLYSNNYKIAFFHLQTSFCAILTTFSLILDQD